MQRLHGFFKPFVATIVLLAAAQAAAEDSHTARLAPLVSKKPARQTQAPAFELRDLAGKKTALADFRGRVVVLHFFASWCEPCKEEFPALERLHAKLGGRGLAVVAVAQDSRTRAEGFAKSRSITFPVLVDQYGELMRSYGVGAIPMSVVVGRTGSIEGVVTGPNEYDGKEAQDHFLRLLSREHPPSALP